MSNEEHVTVPKAELDELRKLISTQADQMTRALKALDTSAEQNGQLLVMCQDAIDYRAKVQAALTDHLNKGEHERFAEDFLQEVLKIGAGKPRETN